MVLCVEWSLLKQKQNKTKKGTGGEWFVEPSPKILVCDEKATATATITTQRASQISTDATDAVVKICLSNTRCLCCCRGYCLSFEECSGKNDQTFSDKAVRNNAMGTEVPLDWRMLDFTDEILHCNGEKKMPVPCTGKNVYSVLFCFSDCPLLCTVSRG